jgi:2-polyprenyl-6-methoxyphenol hydroxylase-like FAD-dependent oxidoreductase
MAKVAVIGAGLAGLATSLFLARRGHQVALVEKDPDPPPEDAEACFQTWARRGVPQARQPHVLLARSSAILRAEAPDVLDAFAEAGANFVTGALQAVDPHRTKLPFFVAARRLVFEAVMRRKALAEANVQWLGGREASGLVLRAGADAPVVTGVTLADGETLEADLTVDASGRFSLMPRWLEEAGLGQLEEDFQDCGFCYMSRWYRLAPGQARPGGLMPIFANSRFATFFGFLADNDVFCLGMTLSVKEPLSAKLRKPSTFERVLAAIPETAAWLSRAEPISDIHVLARIENRSRTLIKDGAPLAAGLVLVGDSAMHTNPTQGRGVTMAYIQAQKLAEMLSEGDPATAAFVETFEAWRPRELGVWFDGQARLDAGRIAQMDAALAGAPPAPPPSDPTAQFFAAVPAVAQINADVALALSRMGNMLMTPADLASDPVVLAAVSDYLAGGGGPPPLTGPTREAFVSLAAG